MKICPMGVELFYAEGRTDGQCTGMMKLVVTFHNFVNELQNWWNVVYRKEVPCVGYNVET